MEKNVSAIHLRELIELRHKEQFRLIADLFALGCYFHMQGKKEVGKKLVKEVLDSVRVHGTKMYTDAILDNLATNEKRFAAEVYAHVEVNELFREEQHGCNQ